MPRRAILYGLAQCSTCQKAARALSDNGFELTIHDVREQPLAARQLETWHTIFGDRLCNRASLTWRNLSESERQRPLIERLLAHPSLMKRPLIVVGNEAYLGWSKAVQQTLEIAG